MKQYELILIAKANVGEDGSRDVFNSINDVITSNGGRILNSDNWGRRKFSYEINHEKEGFYQVVQFETEASKITNLKNKLNLNSNIVRYLITATE